MGENSSWPASKTNEEPLVLYTMVIKSFSKNFRDSKLNMLFESDIPFHKSMIRFDHFMMKIQESIQQAFQDFQPGRMGTIR